MYCTLEIYSILKQTVKLFPEIFLGTYDFEQ